MSQRYEYDGRILEIRQDWIDVTTALPQSDPKWTFTDAAGHPHAYGGQDLQYPTLVIKSGEPYWCEDCEDEHVDEWYECALCGEKIRPGTHVDTSPKQIPGLRSATIDGEPATEQQVEAFIATSQAARG